MARGVQPGASLAGNESLPASSTRSLTASVSEVSRRDRRPGLRPCRLEVVPLPQAGRAGGESRSVRHTVASRSECGRLPRNRAGRPGAASVQILARRRRHRPEKCVSVPGRGAGRIPPTNAPRRAAGTGGRRPPRRAGPPTLPAPLAPRRRPGQLDHGTALLPTEAQLSERFRFQPGQVFRPRERGNRPLFPGDNGAVVLGQAVEQADAERQRDLLASDRVDDALEHGSKARRLHAAEPLRQGTQFGIARGQAIERRQVDAKAEQPFQGRRYGLLPLGVSGSPCTVTRSRSASGGPVWTTATSTGPLGSVSALR